jgi:hypothetical protein
LSLKVTLELPTWAEGLGSPHDPTVTVTVTGVFTQAGFGDTDTVCAIPDVVEHIENANTISEIAVKRRNQAPPTCGFFWMRPEDDNPPRDIFLPFPI